MKNLYRITNKAGIHLCYQVAKCEADAISFARMYGHKAVKAVFVREEQ